MDAAMIKPTIAIRLFTFTLMLSTTAFAEKPVDPANGQLYRGEGEVKAWSESAGQWLSVEGFWLAFADTNDGRFWGRAADYPPYNELNERDALLVELEQGSCLMYFWHGRWRRAQDVWRWDDAFNDQLGCPYVFN